MRGSSNPIVHISKASLNEGGNLLGRDLVVHVEAVNQFGVQLVEQIPRHLDVMVSPVSIISVDVGQGLLAYLDSG